MDEIYYSKFIKPKIITYIHAREISYSEMSESLWKFVSSQFERWTVRRFQI